MACKPKDRLSRLVDDKWIMAAFRFMQAMNPDNCVLDLKLGGSRPHTEGPYSFGFHKIESASSRPYWTEAILGEMLGNSSKKLFKGYNKSYIKFTTDKLDITA